MEKFEKQASQLPEFRFVVIGELPNELRGHVLKGAKIDIADDGDLLNSDFPLFLFQFVLLSRPLPLFCLINLLILFLTLLGVLQSGQP